MKNKYVRDLEPNQSVTTYFLVQSKELRFRKSGEPYLALHLSDRSGQLEAKMWEGVEEVADTFDRDDFVKVFGSTQIYRNRPQITVHRLRRAEESEVEIEDFLPRTSKDIDKMFEGLRESVAEIQNPYLKRLLESFLDDEDVASRLKVAPAAKTLHHAFLGGLLEHITSLLNLARLAAVNYDFIDADLLKTGVILHDLGKIDELTYGRTFGYSTEGQLLGHIVMVLRMLDRKCATIPDFPPKLKTLIEHMILSHHGRYEFGSPKLPMFPEALMLHYLDDLDSKLESMRDTVANDLQEEEWTRFNPSLERNLLKKEHFLTVTKSSRQSSLKDNKASVGARDRDSGGSSQDSQTGGASAGSRRQSGKPLSLFGERLKSAVEGGSENE